MDLGTLREQWVRESGRYDRVKTVGQDTFADNGANLIINMGIRFLDTRVDTPDSQARYLDINVTSGSFIVKCLNLRVLSEVWCSYIDTSARWRLSQMDMRRLRSEYATDMSLITPGMPVHYALMKGRLAPENVATDFDDAVDYEDTFRGADFGVGYQGIIIGPPSDSDLVVSLWGKFFSQWLSDDDEYNWWTVHYPLTVMHAASYVEETLLRNRQGQDDWLTAIDRQLATIEGDVIEQESEDITDFIEV